ncbi:peptidoglycan D,D-transpeptidase FtsI family protein [Bacillus sp. 123MFChir2]|uniref:peptidoglycan D,D-transpeptidase FtsI family protein n=1 Tax=Bacillus sp. 123MFChir2 TaxID=1169144 RepID=UPI0003685752|nr:penicillin-binding transpeptidase domain-containing protein [Bacillus sp. 123MFChir2]
MNMQQRIIIILIAFMCIICILLGRLLQIQLVETESFTDKHINLIEKSVAQRTQAMIVDDGRGRFTDRNGEELIDDNQPMLILFPFLQSTTWPMQKIAHIIGAQEKDIEKQIRRAKQPVVFQRDEEPLKLTNKQMKQVNDLKIPGVIAVHVRNKQANMIAEHFIGITGENEEQFVKRYGDKEKQKTPVGISGLQRSFDEFLLSDGEAKILYHVDGQGEPIFGRNVKYTYPANPFYPLRIETTLDKSLQMKAEDLIDEYKLVKGGLILLDIQTNEILAMVSKPSLHTNNKEAYKRGASNQMLIPHFPGSVFKTVIAAAAIEEGILIARRRFDCNMDLYGEEKADRMMGTLSFTESFSRSCNRTFADLGRELLQKDKMMIEKYVEALGASKSVGWEGTVFHTTAFRQFTEEKEGTIWRDERDKNVRKAIAQTAIGQKDVRVSPLAVANMMATIARGGEKKEVKAVRDITYKNGTKVFHFEDHVLQGKTLKRNTIKKVQKLLRSVVTASYGTGSAYQSLPFTIAGKSGTAQTGKENYENRWFAGYFPYENPRYVLVVVDLETNRKDNVVTQVFADYVKEIHKAEQLRK